MEEGEGLGPRKEFYALASAALASAWKDKVALTGTISAKKGDVTVTGQGTRFTTQVKAGMRVSLGLGEDDSPKVRRKEEEHLLSWFLNNRFVRFCVVVVVVVVVVAMVAILLIVCVFFFFFFGSVCSRVNAVTVQH